MEGEWDGTEAGLVEVIKRNPVTDDDGNPSPEMIPFHIEQ